jgi:uncharacterized protein YjbI with pentapeptide repeats
MTVRDWLELLIVPLALVVISFLFTTQQDQRQQRTENQRARQAQKIENKRAEAERELAEQQAQDEALQAYFDQMSQLMLDRKLLEAEQGDPVYTLAQARTSTAILRLDAEHNKSVIRFLDNSGLAGTPLRAGTPVSESSVSLFRGIDLSEANLSEAFLPNADLEGADLSKAYLRYADLSGANLSGAGMLGADLEGTDLSGANVSEAYLFLTDLSDADLRGAQLRKADLGGADLSDARLNGAKGVTEEQLERDAKTLGGATLPDGSRHP